MFCKKCGNEVNDGAAFCPKCGAQVVIPKSMVSDENSSGQATAEVISNNKMDSTLRLVATILFSVWTIFLIFVVWFKDYIGYCFDIHPYFYIPTLSCIISNLCMIYAFLKQESKFIKASLGIGLLGNAVTIIIRVVELYKNATTIQFTGYRGWTRQAYLIQTIIGYDITGGGYQYEFPMNMFYTLSIILGVVLFALFLRKLHHHISTIFTGIIIALWTICFVWWSLSSEHPELKGWTPMPLFPLATFLGIAVYALLSIILTRNQAK